jgi:hypothetical protein
MSTLIHRRLSPHIFNRLIDEAPVETVALTDDHRRSLTSRFRAVASATHRRLDSWMVERAGEPYGSFRWSPVTARRVLGNAALRRMQEDPTLTELAAVDDEVVDQLLRAAAGYARPGSLGDWLAMSPPSAVGLVKAEAANWTTQLGEAAESIFLPWSVATSDAYYDVAKARTTLRGRRDLIIEKGEQRLLTRVRAGAPGKSAGPGLRADLTIDALAHHEGVAATRILGLRPEAGVILCVDATMDDLRAGARDLVRTAVAQQRRHLSLVA